MLTTNGYDPYGFTTSIYTEAVVQDLEYSFNIRLTKLAPLCRVILKN
jgi:hypothetical protein